MARDVRFALGYSDAEAFYTTPLGPTDSNGNRHKNSGLGWNREAFRAVDWEALDATLHTKNANVQAMVNKAMIRLLWHSNNGGSLGLNERWKVP